MTYCHLLSRRNALLRSATVVVSVLFAACGDSLSSPEPAADSPQQTADSPTSTVVGMVASPDNPVIAPAQSTALRATAILANGLRKPLDAEWHSLDGGTIEKTVIDSETVSIFKSDSAGEFRIVGSSASFSLTDTTTVIVPSVASTSSITRLYLLPERPTIEVNDTLTFTAYGRTSTGDSVPAAVTLAADRGYVRGMMYYTPITGTFRVVATLSGGTVKDTSFVTVVAAETSTGTTSTSTSGTMNLSSTTTIARLYLLPDRPTIEVNDTLTFTAYGRTSTGDSVPAAVTLAADRGYVRGMMYYTPITGTFRVVATLSGGTVKDTSFVTVVAAGTSTGTTSPATGSTTTTTTSSSTTSVAEMPRTYLDTRFVAPTGAVIRVPAGGNLQVAINSAVRGDVIELAAGATFTGNYVLPPKGGTGWVTIRTATTLPPEGVRVTPTAAANFAKIVTANSMPAIRTYTSPSTSFYRIVGVDLRSSAPLPYGTYSIVDLGDYSNTATSVGGLPTDIVLDRVWIHGHSTQIIQRCLTLNIRRAAIVDSRLSECHLKGGDSQAIVGWNGPGPFKIVNNYIEGAGENVMFGGADPKFSGLIPSDIEFRRNHVTRPLAWQASGAWSIKNLLELKNAQRVLIEDNVFENNWADGQTGFAVVLKSQNQGGKCTWCVTQDVNWRFNKIINSPGGFNILATQALSGGGAVPARRISILHTVFDKVGLLSQPGTQRIFQLLGNLTYVTIEHTTSLTQNHAVIFDGAPASAPNYVIRNNIFARGQYGFFGSGKGEGSVALNYYAAGSVFAKNAGIAAASSIYPTGNYYPSSTTTAGLLNYSTGDYRLASTSPYLTTATDGTMIGADAAQLETRLAGVR